MVCCERRRASVMAAFAIPGVTCFGEFGISLVTGLAGEGWTIGGQHRLAVLVFGGSHPSGSAPPSLIDVTKRTRERQTREGGIGGSRRS